MVREGLVLLRMLLLSTSQLNVWRHTHDKGRRRRIVGNAVGFALLLILLLGYGIATCVGYAAIGLTDVIPVLCALTISVLAFVLTLFESGARLFGARDTDLLLSMPLRTSTVVACRFCVGYVRGLPWYACLAVAVLVGYGANVHPSILVYPTWMALSCVLPLLPMLAATLVGLIFARIGAGRRASTVIQTFLTLALVLAGLCARFIIEGQMKSGAMQSTLETLSQATDGVAHVYLPIRWFADAVTKGSVSGALALVGVSVLAYVLVFHLIGRSYLSLSSALASHASAGTFELGAQRRNSVVNAIAFKEFKRLTGSTVYFVNGVLGEILAVLLGVATLVVGFDNVMDAMTQGAPFDHAILMPAFPLIIYFFIGMVATTAISPSLEGRSYWIVASLPIGKETLYRSKMVFNLYLTVPATLFATACLCVSARVPLVETLLYLVEGIALCAFSTAWGCVCGIRHRRLDWEAEIEVVKQGAAVTLYLLPNMFCTMGLCVLVVVLGMHVDHVVLALVSIVVVGSLAVLSYCRAMVLARRMG